MDNYDNMSSEELRHKLKELEDLLEEVEEERQMILGQGNLHLPSRLVIKYADELKEIREKIDLVERFLKERGFSEKAE